VIEKASGQSEAHYLEQHIFKPLQMDHTGSLDPKTVRRLLSQERGPLLTPSDLRDSLWAGIGLYSTAQDMYRWDRALYTEAVISRHSVDEMSVPYRDGYGFGSVVLEELGRKVITQGRGIELYSASLRRYPDDDACVMVLGERPNTDAARISHDLAALLFGAHYELPTERHVLPVGSVLWDRYQGEYALTPYFALTVTREGDRWMIQGGQQVRTEIFPESQTRFFVKDAYAEITFVGNAREVKGLVLQQGGLDIAAQKFH
jgi:hypothetical protein